MYTHTYFCGLVNNEIQCAGVYDMIDDLLKSVKTGVLELQHLKRYGQTYKNKVKLTDTM